MKARVKMWKEEAGALVSEEHGSNLQPCAAHWDFFSKTEKLLYCLSSSHAGFSDKCYETQLILTNVLPLQKNIAKQNVESS